MLTNSNFYIGDAPVSRLYQGENLIWDSTHPDILCEYLSNDSSGAGIRPNVYFDTGVYPDSSTDVEISYQISEWPITGANDSAILFGCTQTTASYSYAGDYYIGAPFLSDGTFYACRFRNQSTILCTAAPDTGKHIIRTVNTASMQTLYYDDSSISAAPTSVRTKEITAYIFSRRYNNTTSLTSYRGTRIYYCKIWQSNNLIRFYIPVLHWTNGQYVACFYDKVNDSYLYNLGTDVVTYKMTGDYLLDYIANGPDAFSAVDVYYDSSLDSSVNLYYDVILKTPDSSVWSGYRTLFGVGTTTGIETGQAYSHQALYTYNAQYSVYNGVYTYNNAKQNISTNSGTNAIGTRTVISTFNSNSNFATAFTSTSFNKYTSVSAGPAIPEIVPTGSIIFYGERYLEGNISKSYSGTRFYALNFRYANNTPAKTFIPVLHNGQAAFLDLNSGTYIYNIGTQTPYYILKS